MERKMAEGLLEMQSTWEEALFYSLFRMIQAIRIHQDNNQLVERCLTTFQESVSRLNLETDITINLSEGRFFVQGEKIRYRKQLMTLINRMLQFFRRRAIEGVRINPAVKEISHGELLAFMRLLIQCAEKTDPAGWLLEQTKNERFSWITILKGTEVKRRPIENLREKAKSTYFHAMNSVRDVAQRISSQGYAGIRKSKRMVQNMLDCLAEDEALFLCLSTIKDHDDYTYTHSVNVAVLSLCLGNRIGLSRNSLEHLGICGLFHDLGKVDIPPEILTKPGRLSRDEWAEMRKHPPASVRQILKLRASHEVKSKILLAPFEHHLKYNLSGYPRAELKKTVSLFGRILQIADVYDAVTSARSYRSYTLSPDQAISHMMKGSGQDYDPILLKVFAMMMGTYPVGTLLELDTGEMGVVVDYPMETGGGYPRVLFLEKDEKGKIKGGDTVSLAERDPKTGTLLRHVVSSLNPVRYGIQPATFILHGR
jgi:HD-GYP domain-containing protein (c-di-GMP phosphodiesterase class II)